MEKHPYVHGLEESILLKMCIAPKAIYRFSAVPIKVSTTVFTELKQALLKSDATAGLHVGSFFSTEGSVPALGNTE